MSRLQRPAFIAFTLILIVLAGCSGQKQETKPASGGQMIIGITGDVDTFNPLFAESAFAAEINHLIMLGLADLDDKSNFAPEIAASWESNEDNTAITYILRKDAVWADGQPITAYDVKFTYDLLREETLASPRQMTVEFLNNVVVVDSHTVRFEFAQAYPAQMFDTAGEILPRHLLKDVPPAELRAHEFGRSPLASGPFKLAKWENQQYIELIRNENYWGKKPYLDKLIFKIVPDPNSLLMQLESGEIDMMAGVPPSEVARLKQGNPDIDIHQVSGRVFYYVGYNLTNPLFENVEVRRALAMALDRQTMIDALLYGYGTPSNGPLPPIVKWAYNDDVQQLPHDQQKAAAVLAEQGWTDSDGNGVLDKNGREFSFVLKLPTGSTIRDDAAVVIQEAWRKLGLDVKIEPLERNAFGRDMQTKNFDAVLSAWSMSYYIDPTPIFHSQSTHMFNFVSYNSPRADELIEQGRSEMDRAKAAQIWKEFQQQVYNDQPYTFLFWVDKAVAVNNDFKDVTPIALSSLYDVENWYKAKE